MDCFVDGTRRTAPFCADRGRDSARREVGLVSSNGRFRCLGGIRNPLPVSRRDSPRTRFLRQQRVASDRRRFGSPPGRSRRTAIAAPRRIPPGTAPPGNALIQSTGRAHLLADARVAHQHHPGEPEPMPQLVDLRPHGRGIRRVAVEHPHRHRTALAVAQQPELCNLPLRASSRAPQRTAAPRRHCGVRGVPFGSRPPTLASARSHKRGSFPARSCCCMQRRRDTSRHGGLGPRDRILRPGAYRDLRPARTSTPPLARPIDVIDAARRVLHSRCVVRGRAPPRRGGTRHPCRDGHGCKGSHTTPRSLPPAAPAHDSGTKQNA